MKKFVFLLFVLIAGVACSSSVPTRYYLLNSIGDESTSASTSSMDVLGLGPVSLPEYLTRQSIVTSAGGNEVNLSDLHQWAESLEDSIWRVLSLNLRRAGVADRIDPFPFRRRDEIDKQLAVQFIRFERTEANTVALDVRWTLRNSSGKLIKLQEESIRTNCQGSIVSQDYNETAHCMSQALFQLSELLSSHF